jgi:uncharacterized protein with ParB-like and HNH nuclease domain/predicted transport protein
MKATEANLLEFLKKSPQFAIPIYQRTYSWGRPECDQLWDDIMRIGRDEAALAHFIGSIVYVEKGMYSVSNPSPLLVIDGQQRLTTVTLLIEALARNLGDGEPLDGFSAKKLRSYYLLNPLEEGERRYKLILSQSDKSSLIAILDQQPATEEHSSRVEENFKFFCGRVTEAKDELTALCKGLAKLVVVDISLTRGQDNPQLIFESMNSTGRELTQADLIRNFILMDQEPKVQTRLYEKYWRPMEEDFGQEAYASHFDAFMRHYLTSKTGKIPNLQEVYDAFKRYSRGLEAQGIERVVADVRTFAGYYCAMAFESEKDAELKSAFHDLRQLNVDVAYPFLLELYHDYKSGTMTRDEFLQVVRTVEAYVFRRAVCDLPTNSLNKTFAEFGYSLKELKKDCSRETGRYAERILARLIQLPSYRRFPGDREFGQELLRRNLYNFSRRSYCLRRLENHGCKERVSVDKYTIEHIMPQNPTDEWKKQLGEDWERIHQTYLHTLGNLTLTGYNSEYGCKSFAQKRDMEGGFKQSPLRLNRGLGQLECWNEAAILARAEKLAEKAVEVWPTPVVDEVLLGADRPPPSSIKYSIKDHPHLLSPRIGPVFEAFRREVLALDPCVTEEFLKAYVAYKAETNFVDAEPRAARLLLTLNVKFQEIDDPEKMCRDVTNIGHVANGDVEVGLDSVEQLPYIMGLVRRAFEKQMGSGVDS